MISKKLGNPFQNLPAPKIPRSVHNLSHSVTTTMNVGTLYPIDWQEVLPGDTFNCKATNVSRLTSTFIHPVMDNLYLDIYHFYVPYSQVYDYADDVFGEANPSQYSERELKSLPSIPSGSCYSGSIGDYLGIPPNMLIQTPISLVPFRAFAHIYNEWFRNENVVDEVYIQRGERTTVESLNDNPWSPSNYTGRPPKVSKYKDYFTSALPSPQKGQSVPIPFEDMIAPVYAGEKDNPLPPGTSNGIRFMNGASLLLPGSSYPVFMQGDVGGSSFKGTLVKGSTVDNDSGITPGGLIPINLFANLQNLSSNLNELRFAEAYQHDLELDSLYGTRYNEWLLSHFGVRSDDLEIGIPKYLGGARTPLNVTQVTNNSAGTENSPLGDVGAYSWSVGDSVYRYRFKYHGIVMTVAALRYKHTYQQGLPLKFTKLTSADIYNPSFAYIGMQPIKTTELYASADPESVFGYKPAWNEYRHSFNTISGEARSAAANSLHTWHFADNYSSAPVLSQSFVEENKDFFERTITLDSDSEGSDGQDNFILNFWFDLYAKRPITEFSMPSIDVRMW